MSGGGNVSLVPGHVVTQISHVVTQIRSRGHTDYDQLCVSGFIETRRTVVQIISNLICCY